MVARPAARFDLRPAEIWLGEAAKVQEVLEFRRFREAELRDRQRMKAQQMVSTLQGVVAEPIGAPGTG